MSTNPIQLNVVFTGTLKVTFDDQFAPMVVNTLPSGATQELGDLRVPTDEQWMTVALDAPTGNEPIKTIGSMSIEHLEVPPRTQDLKRLKNNVDSFVLTVEPDQMRFEGTRPILPNTLYIKVSRVDGVPKYAVYKRK